MAEVVAAPPEILERAESIKRSKFENLCLAEPEIRIAWVCAAEIVAGGHERAWRARVSTAEQRAAAPACPDVTITLSIGMWKAFQSEDARDAILAEALWSLAPQWVRSTSRDVKTDALGRPKTKLRPLDIWIGGYREVASWYGSRAPLVRAVALAAARLDQGVLDFLGSSSTTDEDDGQPDETHQHTRQCYDDPGPGHGSPTLVCEFGPEPDDDSSPRGPGQSAGDLDAIAAGAVACNTCNLVRKATEHPCPACGAPDYRRSQADAEADATKPKRRGRKGGER